MNDERKANDELFALRLRLSVTPQKFMEEVFWPHPLTLPFVPSHRWEGKPKGLQCIPSPLMGEGEGFAVSSLRSELRVEDSRTVGGEI